MGKIVDFKEYKDLIDLFKIPDQIDLYCYEHPDFYDWSKLLQKEYPVLKYLCSKSKMYKKPCSEKDDENILYSIFSMPELYYNYLALDITLGNVAIELIKQIDDCYTIRTIFINPNPYENKALEYIFMIHKNFYDELLNSLNKFK